MICINHFKEEDLKQDASKNRMNLKKGAMPTKSSPQNQIEQKNPNNLDCVIDQNDSRLLILEKENKKLRENLEMAEAEISRLKKENVDQKHRFDSLLHSLESKNAEIKTKLATVRSKAFRLENTKSNLKDLLKELKERDILNNKFADTLEVWICDVNGVFYNHYNYI